MMSPFAAKSSATATTDLVLARRAVRSDAGMVVEAEVMGAWILDWSALDMLCTTVH